MWVSLSAPGALRHDRSSLPIRLLLLLRLQYTSLPDCGLHYSRCDCVCCKWDTSGELPNMRLVAPADCIL